MRATGWFRVHRLPQRPTQSCLTSSSSLGPGLHLGVGEKVNTGMVAFKAKMGAVGLTLGREE